MLQQIALICAFGLAGVCGSAAAQAGDPSFTLLGDLPGGSVRSDAHAISADGMVVVGESKSGNGTEAFRWTAATGMVGLGDLPGAPVGIPGFDSSARAVSADGSVIVGNGTSAAIGFEAFRWSAGTGLVGLGDLPGGSTGSGAAAVSADGSVVAGASVSISSVCWEPFRWTNAGGMIGLGHLFSGTSCPIGRSTGISADGRTIVGGDTASEFSQEAFRWTAATGLLSIADNPGSGVFSNAKAISVDGSVIVGTTQVAGQTAAFRWTIATGMVDLGASPGFFAEACAVSGDGSIVVGARNLPGGVAGTRAFIWDAVTGVRDLKDALESDYGLDLGSVILGSANGISADGRLIVGNSVSGPGSTQLQAWIASRGDGDCNNNGIPDDQDISGGFSSDCNGNGFPDECELAGKDCNVNGVLDECDIAGGFSADCNGNGLPDECDIAGGLSADCNVNGVPDECDIAGGFSADCNGNGVPDECDIAGGTSPDADGNGVPDECELLISETAELTASDAEQLDLFGDAVSISGNVAVIGARLEDQVAVRGGSAYVFRRAGSQWIEEAKLNAADTEFEDFFGFAVSISGDVAAVGAPLHNGGQFSLDTGAVYVFRFDGLDWNLEQKLTTSDAAAGDQLGWSLSIDGGVIVAGAPFEDSGGGLVVNGAAYVFRFDGSGWVEEAKLRPSDAMSLHNFAQSVSLDGDTIVAGAAGDNEACPQEPLCSSGAAYVFRFDGASWVEEAKLTASDAAAEDVFGQSVAVSDGVIVSAARLDDDGGTDSGSAYVYRFDGADWLEEAKLTASDADSFDQFGVAVAISSGVVIVGAEREDEAGLTAGAAYVYRFGQGGWSQGAKLHPAEAAAGDHFGQAVAISGSVALVGGLDDDACPSNPFCESGAAYVFGGLSDCNANGILDIADIAVGTLLDVDGNGVPDACEGCQPDLGFSGPGTSHLSVCGQPLSSGNTADLLLTGAPPTAPSSAVFSFTQNPFSFGGGTIVPFPPSIITIFTDTAGELFVPGIAGGGGPFDLYVQFVTADPAQPAGVSISNAVRLEFLP